MCVASRLSAAVAVIAIAALLGAPSSARAQGSPTGSLTGTVADPSGGRAPGVTVVAKGAQTGLTQQRSAAARGIGEFRRCLLAPTIFVRARRVQEARAKRCDRRSGRNPFAAASPWRSAVSRRPFRWPPTRRLLTMTTSTTSRRLTGAELETDSDVDWQLHASAVIRGRRQRRSAARAHQRHGQHLAVGERHPHDEHQPVLQRHRRDEPDHQRRVAERQHLAGLRHARGSQAADQHVRRLDGPFGRRKLPAGDAQRHERVSRAPRTSTSSTRRSTRTTSSTRRTASTSRRPAGTRAASRIGGPIRRNRFFFFGGYQRTQAETGFVPTASSITVLPQALQSDSGRAHEGEPPGGILGAEPVDSAVDSQGAVFRARPTRRASPTWR